jgi:hypothetical protein
MKMLYALLVLSIAAIIVAVGATLWRLRWHLRRASRSSQHALEDVRPEPQPVEKAR